MIQGIGIDLVENDRIEKIMRKWGEKSLQRAFSEEEINYCGKHIQASLQYGARFAAKEAFLKALGIGLGMGVKLREIEVVHSDQGEPDLSLRDEAHLQIEKREIKRIHLSLTHTCL